MLHYLPIRHLHNNKPSQVINLLTNSLNQLILFFLVYILMEVEFTKQLVGMDMIENH